jgi:alpha-mannosidase
MHKADSLRVSRVLRVFNEFVRPARRGEGAGLEIAAYHVHGEPVPVEAALGATFEPFSVGDAWGPAWDTTWFRLRGAIPTGWCDREVHLGFAIGNAGETGFGAEALLYRDGQPVQGLSPNHRSYPVTPRAEGGEPVELYVEAAANPPSPFGANPWPLLMAEPHGTPLFTLARAGLFTVDPAFEAFFHDFRVAVELLIGLPDEEPRKSRLLAGLERAANRLTLPDIGGSWPQAAEVVHGLVNERASPSAHRVSAVGHAHLDTAWLWPLRETVRKCARTFSTVLALMERYPEYHFVVSQAQHLAWMRDNYPDLWERLKLRIAEGRIEPTGSMWVEADCNIPSGESLARQIIHGKRFYLEELGLETDDVWLPDVFGYSAALPQIMQLGGVRRFLTQKLSWNQYNDMPHHSFYWEGIDGSRVFTHFPPADTYGGQFTVRELRHSVNNFRDHEHSGRSLYLFGHSDGGGGPTDDMLESARRLADSEGMPRITMEGPRAFFDQAESAIVDPAVWAGELYLEHHRGTYTTQGATKAGNRRGELALRDAELWASLVGGDYPADELHRAWRTLLLHQFHDIIPGSGIHWVYEDTRRDHAEIIRRAETITEVALAELVAGIDTSEGTRPVVVWNSLSHARTGLVETTVPAGSTAARAESGQRAPIQPVGDSRALFLATVPPCGYRVYDLVAAEPDRDRPPAEAGSRHLQNEHLRIELDDDGLLSSVFDRSAERQVLAPGGRGNLLQLHPDYPNFFDAWDIDAWYRDQVEDITSVDTFDVVETGPVRAAIRVTRSFGQSSIAQIIRLAAGSPVLEVCNEVDWHEENRLLKVAFPLAVHSPRATFEIQYGHVERPTHTNTSWEAARFEVCAQRWADYSEPGYGAALLNDCKYGYDIRADVLRLSLLRSPNWPDPEADRGAHRFTYQLFPHAGDLRPAGVIDAAYDLNVQLRAVPAPPSAPAPPVQPGEPVDPDEPGESASATRGPSGSFLSVDAPNVVVEAVKRSDDGSGALVVRLYEAWGARGPVTLSAPWPLSRASRTDLLEREEAPVPCQGEQVAFELVPFQILTLKLERADS